MKVIIFAGQGNTKVNKLRSLLQTTEGKALLNELKNESELLEEIDAACIGALPIVHYELYATFLANEIYWRKLGDLGINQRQSVSMLSHSAGIFNMLSASQVIKIPTMLRFLRKRALLFEQYQGDKRLVLYMTPDVLRLRELMDQARIDYDQSIITDVQSGVFSISEADVERVKKLALTNKLTVKFHSSGIQIPYHSRYLSVFRSQYEALINELFDQVDQQKLVDYQYFLESENIRSEILRQLDGQINWDELLKRLRAAKPETIFDSSANAYLVKKFRRDAAFKGIELIGDELWRK